MKHTAMEQLCGQARRFAFPLGIGLAMGISNGAAVGVAVGVALAAVFSRRPGPGA